MEGGEGYSERLEKSILSSYICIGFLKSYREWVNINHVIYLLVRRAIGIISRVNSL